MPDPKSIDPAERPDLTPDSNVEAGVRGTFPASDPVATTASQGARAVPVERMMAEDEGPPDADAATLTQRFPDAESAKLALEALVREGPVDRHCAELHGAELVLRVPRPDATRLEALLRKQAATSGPATGPG
jgi:hypothetical protein